MEVQEAETKSNRIVHKCPKCDRTFANIGHMKCHFYRVHPEFKLSEFEIPEVAAPAQKTRPPLANCPKGETYKPLPKKEVKEAEPITLRVLKPKYSPSPVELVLPDLPAAPVEPVSLNKIHQMLFKCDECSKCFSNSVSLQKHCVSIHSVFQCTICKGTFPNSSRLKSHMEVHSTKMPKSKKARLEGVKLSCKLCNRGFAKQTTLHAHMQHDHATLPDADFVKCAECREIFSSKSELKNHMAVHRSDKSQDVSEKKGDYSCDVCDKTFARKCNLDKHAVLHKVD